ncbi:tRNA (adenine(22)-N(1))-methyltransferase [Enterococcus alishanensis]|uniref:tRNA (Adenine(22)-N(1))-methyltransferase TrmK n=1 Tax=Enterococcus alishanensis TaxID=1303817 RepID=A0ABS6TBQ6_9ENTE|nr:tRNA (adenine(22)-N(1))-methyltransferase TrmK [Enterococcus alishanensis]MBV7390322.1 tRNA (adenine(22)-N(1))-methyltransferase TrmK [Enterococcus alishanensis]
MKVNQLSKRLQKVAEYVPKDARLADIGSDHAYLPVALTLQNKINFAIAGEVVPGPFEAAKKQVAENNLEEKIIVRLADGLAAVKESDNISAVTICGMGGVLIRDILQSGKDVLSGDERLILQPNVAERQLRTWLVENKYEIIDEAIIRENHKTYEIIVAEKGNAVSYSDKDLFFGPLLIEEKNPIFIQKWNHKLEKSKSILTNLKQGQATDQKIHRLETEIAWIQEVLADESN